MSFLVHFHPVRRVYCKKNMKKILFVLALLCVGGAVYYVTHRGTGAPKMFLRTVSLQRGDLQSTVNATGTLQPEEVVNVGAQVAGLIVKFGEDPNTPSKHVDYCSIVEQDDVLAWIDPTFHEAAVEQAEAMLQSAEANLLLLEARLQHAENEFKRQQPLRGTGAISETEYDAAVTDYKIAQANVDIGKATIRQNKAQVNTAKINLGYCTIKSPVHGTVIERRVNIGQTVVASLNAPSLFLIAKDLSKMEVWTSVNEADIGKIRLDMPVRFTVDTHEDEVFRGVVTQIRMNAQMSQNVVTYTVVVTTDNSSGLLLPYLTANVHFEVETRHDVLLVPNVALRWSPDVSQLDPSVSKSILDEPVDRKEGKGRIWVTEGDHRVRPIDVIVGVSDGSVTEISNTEAGNTEVGNNALKEGLLVVIGEAETSADNADENTSNPFLPKFPNRRR